MAHTNLESATKRLLTKLRSDLEGHAQVEQDPPRSERRLDSLIADALERLSLGARALLAWVLTRQEGFVLSLSLANAVGEDRIGLHAALYELEGKGYAKHTGPNRWEFFVAPMPSRAVLVRSEAGIGDTKGVLLAVVCFLSGAKLAGVGILHEPFWARGFFRPSVRARQVAIVRRAVHV